MCIACELRMFFAMEDLPPSTGTASHEPAETTQKFVCETPEDAPRPPAPTSQDERKSIVKSRE
jgi:hypothetical protein